MVDGFDIVHADISVGRNNAEYHCPSHGITQDALYHPVEQLELAVCDQIDILLEPSIICARLFASPTLHLKLSLGWIVRFVAPFGKYIWWETLAPIQLVSKEDALIIFDGLNHAAKEEEIPMKNDPHKMNERNKIVFILFMIRN
jgi:hypothetical protein